MSHPKKHKNQGVLAVVFFWFLFFWEAIHCPDPCSLMPGNCFAPGTWAELNPKQNRSTSDCSTSNLKMMTSKNGISSSRGFHVRFSGVYASDKTCDHLPSLPCLTYISHREVVEEDHYPPKIKATMGTKIIKDLICHNHDGIW